MRKPMRSLAKAAGITAGRVSTIVSYNTVHHDATGHYETVEDGGHWE